MKNKRVTTLQESTHLHRHQYYTTKYVNKNTQPQVVIPTAMNSLSNDRIFYLERVLEGRWYMWRWRIYVDSRRSNPPF